ncbi:response regulator [Ancylobacter mangrovi]|uniref:Response regulator n=1 Tax=Ancylobacter mangrovi TaxID=2972472 RepID=A0A9X2PGB1_9HYPH|nr:response regulator [Ancylobacter mangrovi]MCS0495495.1 response regulator [Ancylobacter mangrovi]MCS0503143.1 response regulator [Ancylobacter mangrovi]
MPVRVHVVEDDAGVSDSLSLILQNLGHEVILYPDAEGLLRTTPPAGADTVIVDLSLPGISGGQLIRWLQKLASPPVLVVITGQSQGAIDHQLRGVSPVRVLRKPLNAESLLHVLTGD